MAGAGRVAGSNLIKPSASALADPQQALLIFQRFFEALSALQAAQGAAAPASIAEATGKAEVAVIRGATVTLPGSTATLTMDIYVTGVRV